ncbi:MAG: 1-deoxy-D-xylulose-5-phosphate reductoisomerase [Burkholderiaceae bacterium]
MKRRITLLGATGSIGASTLDVLTRHPDRYEVHALTAASRVQELADLCARHRPQVAVIADETRLDELAAALRERGLNTVAAAGAAALVEVAKATETDIVVAAIVGAAGLMPTIAAARAGKQLLLANKESVVCGGVLLMDAVAQGGGALLPVDSEHNAIHQCLAAASMAQRSQARLILTASGGPFRTRMDLSGVTPEQACAHPNWVMGRKISVDSATLMNKGLEVIEASWLFDFPAERIDVVVHPQSVIHSMVEYADGSVLAQLGSPDMRTPIAYSLAWPERIESGTRRLNFMELGALSFEAPDTARFPLLAYAYDALRAGGSAPTVLNAANEIAVEAFLDRRLGFTSIARLCAEVLGHYAAPAPRAVSDVVAIDAEARRLARLNLAQFPSA